MEGIRDIEGHPSYEVRSEEFTQRVDNVLEVIHLRIGQHFNGSCTRITEEGFEDRYIRVVVGIENKEITDHFATTLEELAEELKAEKIFDEGRYVKGMVTGLDFERFIGYRFK